MASLILAVVLGNELTFTTTSVKTKEVGADLANRAASLEQRAGLFSQWLDARSLVDEEWKKLRVVCVGRSFSASDKDPEIAQMETDAEVLAKSIKAKVADKPYADKFEILEERHSTTRVEQAIFFFYKLKQIIKEFRESEEGKRSPETITIELSVFTSYFHMAETYFIFKTVYENLKLPGVKDEQISFVNIPVLADSYNLEEPNKSKEKSYSNKKLMTNRVINSKETALNPMKSDFGIMSTTFEKIRSESKPTEPKQPADPTPEGETQVEQSPVPLGSKEVAAMTGVFGFFERPKDLLLTLSSSKVQSATEPILSVIKQFKSLFLKIRGIEPNGSDALLTFVQNVATNLLTSTKTYTIPILIQKV